MWGRAVGNRSKANRTLMPKPGKDSTTEERASIPAEYRCTNPQWKASRVLRDKEDLSQGGEVDAAHHTTETKDEKQRTSTWRKASDRIHLPP